MLVFLCVSLLDNFCVRVFESSVCGPALFRCVCISCERLLRTYIFEVCVYMLWSMFVCVCASAVNCWCAHIYFKCAPVRYTSLIFIVAVYMWVSSVHIYIYICVCVCVCACVRVGRKGLMRPENIHIYTSSIFIVAVYMWVSSVHIHIYIYVCVWACVRARWP